MAWGLGVAAVCAVACIAPTLRALRVEPARALSADGYPPGRPARSPGQPGQPRREGRG